MKKREIPSDGLTPILCYRALGGVGCCIFEEGKSSFVGIDPVTSGLGRSFGLISYEGAVFLKHYRTIIQFEGGRVIFTHDGSDEELDALIDRCFQPQRLKPFHVSKKLSVQSDLSRDEFAVLVERAQEFIRAGDIFQVVLSRDFSVDVKASPLDIYRAIKQVSPAPYHFFFEEEDFAIAGASPELLISVKDKQIESMPIAGTRAKGSGVDLLADPKEAAEHVMLVDLARNDLGRVAKVGSVKVADYKKVKSFSHVDHIVSRVVGELREGMDAMDALKASFPAGTLSGAPKVRAMEIIAELEKKPRGFYGGAVAMIDEKGNLTSCIAIRFALIKNGRAVVRAGAGVVLDSIGENEALETEHKASGVLAAIELAEGAV